MGVNFEARVMKIATPIQVGPTGGVHSLSAAFTLARPAELAQSIATAIKAGRKVVLLDVNFLSKVTRDGNQTIRDLVVEQGIDPAKLEGSNSMVINLDHHVKEQEGKTATEIVFENLDRLRALDNYEVIINHGDTDSLLSAYVARNPDMDFDAVYSSGNTIRSLKSLILAAALAGDHGKITINGQETKIDFKMPLESLPDEVRLDLALTQIALEEGLAQYKIGNTDRFNDAKLKVGIDRTTELINRVLENNPATILRQQDLITLMEKSPSRFSWYAIEHQIPGITIDRSVTDSHGVAYPIVVANLDAPGLDDFFTLAGFSADTKPAIILIVRNNRVVGVGRNNSCENWLNLNNGFYTLFGGRLQGREAAGGKNLATPFNEMPTPEEGLKLAQDYLQNALRTA